MSIPADKNKPGLLQVGWHGGWYNPILGYGHGKPDPRVVEVGSDALHVAGNCD